LILGFNRILSFWLKILSLKILDWLIGLAKGFVRVDWTSYAPRRKFCHGCMGRILLFFFWGSSEGYLSIWPIECSQQHLRGADPNGLLYSDHAIPAPAPRSFFSVWFLDVLLTLLYDHFRFGHVNLLCLSLSRLFFPFFTKHTSKLLNFLLLFLN